MDTCSAKQARPPVVKSTPDYQFPKGAKADDAVVTLSMIVGIDGKPSLIRVSRSGGTAFDAEAIREVGTWRFWPAACQGKPTSAMINVQLGFHR